MSILEKFDLFKQPVRLSIAQDKKPQFDNGSALGGCFSLAFGVISLLYFISEFNLMNSNEYDDFSSFKIANNFEEYNEFYLKDTQFLPTIEVLANNINVKDILKDEKQFEATGWYEPLKIDLPKLNKYIDIEITYR